MLCVPEIGLQDCKIEGLIFFRFNSKGLLWIYELFKSYVNTLFPFGLPPELSTLSQMGCGNSYLQVLICGIYRLFLYPYGFQGGVDDELSLSAYITIAMLEAGHPSLVRRFTWYSDGTGPQLLPWVQHLLNCLGSKETEREGESSHGRWPCSVSALVAVVEKVPIPKPLKPPVFKQKLYKPQWD